MDFKCSYNLCKNTPDYYCKCEGHPEIICEDHCIDHLKNNKFMAHHILPVFKRVSKESQSNIINYLKDLINTNNSIKQSLLETTDKILSISAQIIKIINQINKFIFSNINQVYKNLRIFIPSSTFDKESADIYKTNDFSNHEINNLVFEFSKKYNLEKLQETFNINSERNQTLISSIIEKNYGENINIRRKNFEKNSDKPINFDENELYFFQHNSTVLYKFTPNNETINSRNIQNLQTQGFLASICKVDDQNLFVYGGYTNIQLTHTFLLNILNNTVTILPEGEKCVAASCQLFQNKVYIFGGQATNVISESRYFDLVQKKWVSIAPLPSPQRDTSTLLLNLEILITGHQNFLHSYNLSTNQYKNLNSGITIGHKNILIQYSDKIFLLVNNLVYLCDEFVNKTKWNQVNSSSGFEHTTSKPCFHGKYAYFVTNVHKIYKFDCETRVLTMIKQI